MSARSLQKYSGQRCLVASRRGGGVQRAAWTPARRFAADVGSAGAPLPPQLILPFSRRSSVLVLETPPSSPTSPELLPWQELGRERGIPLVKRGLTRKVTPRLPQQPPSWGKNISESPRSFCGRRTGSRGTPQPPTAAVSIGAHLQGLHREVGSPARSTFPPAPGDCGDHAATLQLRHGRAGSCRGRSCWATAKN